MQHPDFKKFQFVFQEFVRFVAGQTAPYTYTQEKDFSKEEITFSDQILTLICAFNRTLFGREHPQYEQAREYLERPAQSEAVKELASFLRNGLDEISREVNHVLNTDADFVHRLNAVYRQLTEADENLTAEARSELFWRIFFPEGTAIFRQREKAEKELRERRKVRIRNQNSQPLSRPATEILFTSNVLLTVPLKEWDLEQLPLSDRIKNVLRENRDQPQSNWYDHPIPVGIAPEKNEVLYGLRGLNEMMAFEKRRGTATEEEKLTVVLSCSVTHTFLHQIAKDYLQQTIRQAGGFEHLDVYLFTEQDVRDWLRLFFDEPDWQAIGVDGPYGRHYSFLKAIAAWWQVFVDPKKKATFKIDLDQVFDQERLVAETGYSALEHFKTALWGADGRDADGRPIHLGMIAGALVNATDIQKSLFTPDVPYPERPQHADEFVFFSRLPQALSTRAEMMARYDTPQLDGQRFCLQRVHVTGGTNGILIDALRRFKPFTPSFIGRAEDQAYLLSTMGHGDGQLGYVHKPGLIMRHDKELFASEAIKAAEIGKMIGDYERILYFSAYARVLGNGDYRKIKQRVDPFTGCFISAIPTTVVYLRFLFRLKEFLQQGYCDEAREWVRIGVPRLQRALEFVRGENNALKRQFERERKEWDLFYRALQAYEKQAATVQQEKRVTEFLEAIRIV